MFKKVSLVLACTMDGGIGHDNKMPWYIPQELKKFKTITSNVDDDNKINAVIMGRDTWEAMNENALPNRLNIVLSTNKFYTVKNHSKHKVMVAHNLQDAMVYAHKEYIETIFIIGGARLYNMFLESEYYFQMIDKIYLSVIFYDQNIFTNKFVNMNNILRNFKILKDKHYQNEADDRLFASFVCIPNKQFNGIS